MTARAVIALAGIGLLAGCSPAASGTVGAAPAASVTTPLATSMTVAGGGTWAIMAMGSSAENKFWELFNRPAASSRWSLVTPPGIADNGGLVAASSGDSVTVAIRPSQGLTYSPLASTSDGGKTWGTGLVDASVARVPDAFAADGGKTLALLGNGAIDQTTGAGAHGTRLAAPGAIAASAAGRRCEVTGLTAVAYTASGTPLAAASCARPGTVGIFALTGTTWEATGSFGSVRGTVRVLRLTGTSSGDVALLQSGASLLAAWTRDGMHWTVSSPLPAGSGQVLASGTGPGSAVWVLLPGDRAEALTGTGAAWRELPAPPRGTAALAAGPGGTFEALATTGGTLTVLQLTPAGAWSAAQVIKVPLQYGSSG